MAATATRTSATTTIVPKTPITLIPAIIPLIPSIIPFDMPDLSMFRRLGTLLRREAAPDESDPFKETLLMATASALGFQRWS